MNEKIDALRLLFSIDRRLRESEGTADVIVRRLEKRRASLRKEISKLLLKSYDALMSADRYPPVVEARGSHCGGCNLRITPQLACEIRRGELRPCPHCRRLLFDDAHRETLDSGRSATVRSGVLRSNSVSGSPAAAASAR